MYVHYIIRNGQQPKYACNATHISHVLFPASSVLLDISITLLYAIHSKAMAHVVLPVPIIHRTCLLPHLGALACRDTNGRGQLASDLRKVVTETVILQCLIVTLFITSKEILMSTYMAESINNN